MIASVILIMFLIIGLWFSLPDNKKSAKKTENAAGPLTSLWQEIKTIRDRLPLLNNEDIIFKQ